MFNQEELFRLLSLQNQGKLSRQQEQLLSELKKQSDAFELQQRERDNLPDCPHCGNKIPKRNVSTCGQCRNRLFWGSGKPFKTETAAERYKGQRKVRRANRDAQNFVWNHLILHPDASQESVIAAAEMEEESIGALVTPALIEKQRADVEKWLQAKRVAKRDQAIVSGVVISFLFLVAYFVWRISSTLFAT